MSEGMYEDPEKDKAPRSGCFGSIGEMLADLGCAAVLGGCFELILLAAVGLGALLLAFQG